MTAGDESRQAPPAGPNLRALPPCAVITGPTGAGKTSIALSLARALPAHLISVDSVQVYRGMDIGSAKISPETRRRFPHALIDIRDPDQVYTAADFVRDAAAEINKAHHLGKLPVLVGGTIMYLRALRYGLDPMPAADPEIRRSIEREAERLGWAELHHRLAALDPVAAAGIRVNDPQRIQRALEIQRASGRPASSFWSGRGEDRMTGSLMIVVCPADRKRLHQGIDARWQTMLADGLIDETRRLLAGRSGKTEPGPLRSVGYRQVVEFLRGAIDRPTLTLRGAAASRQLAKRQITALRQWTGGFWYDPLNKHTINRIIRKASLISAGKD